MLGLDGTPVEIGGFEPYRCAAAGYPHDEVRTKNKTRLSADVIPDVGDGTAAKA